VSPPPSPSSCSSTPRTCSTCGTKFLKGKSLDRFLHFPLRSVFSQDPVWKHLMDKSGPAGSKACLNHCLFNHYWNIRKPTMDVSLFLPEIKYLMSYVWWSSILMVKKEEEKVSWDYSWLCGVRHRPNV
jgi:NifB/MoaA-like Fe-S oxidoreductase